MDALRVARPLLAIGSAVYVAGWLLVRVVHPEVPDPLAVRVGVIATMLGLLGLTYVVPRVRDDALHVLGLVQWIVTGHQLWLAWRSDMASPHVLSVLSLLGAISAAAPYSHASRGELVLYLGAVVAGSAALVVSVPDADPMFLLAVLALAAVVYVSADSQWRHLARIQAEAAADRELQSRLLQADKMAALGTIIAGVAHEVTNPLTVVIGNLELAESEPDAEAVRAALRDARAAAERVGVIMADLRTYVRPGGQAAAPVDLPRIVESALVLLGTERSARCTVVRRLDAVPPVLANPHRITQVVLNLLQNAMQAAPLERTRIDLRTRTDGDRVVLEVADDGPGVPIGIRRRIFEPFFTTKEVGVGTGLGLFVSHRVVNELGGTLEVLDSPGRGATFRVTLPAARDLPPPPAPTPIPAHPATGRILVVDDEPMVAGAVARLLRGHAVRIATNGRQALELLREEPFDVVLCDLMMPEMDGKQLWEALRAERPGDERRIAFLTGGAFTDEARTFLATVPNQSFLKPVDSRELRAWISQHLAASQ